MARDRHPNKEIEAAISDAEARGWRLRKQGHWGRIYCPQADRDGCQVGIWGTPKNAENHANDIIRAVKRCPHSKESKDDESGN